MGICSVGGTVGVVCAGVEEKVDRRRARGKREKPVAVRRGGELACN